MKMGLKVALVSDAGTPTINDPGFEFLNVCIRQGIKIESLPGPSAVTTAAASSGLCPNGFNFFGYLSKTQSVRDA